jgi:hypothetical protein
MADSDWEHTDESSTDVDEDSEYNLSEHDSDDDSDDESGHEQNSQTDEVDRVYLSVQLRERRVTTGEYKLGMVTMNLDREDFLLMTSVDTKTYFEYPQDTIMRYLVEYSLVYVMNPRFDIVKMRLYVDNFGRAYHYCILKTHYIRLVQRAWRRVMLQRLTVWKQRMRTQSLRHRTVTGKWPNELSLPGIHGMLANMVDRRKRNPQCSVIRCDKLFQ